MVICFIRNANRVCHLIIFDSLGYNFLHFFLSSIFYHLCLRVKICAIYANWHDIVWVFHTCLMKNSGLQILRLRLLKFVDIWWNLYVFLLCIRCRLHFISWAHQSLKGIIRYLSPKSYTVASIRALSWLEIEFCERANRIVLCDLMTVQVSSMQCLSWRGGNWYVSPHIVFRWNSVGLCTFLDTRACWTAVFQHFNWVIIWQSFFIRGEIVPVGTFLIEKERWNAADFLAIGLKCEYVVHFYCLVRRASLIRRYVWFRGIEKLELSRFNSLLSSWTEIPNLVRLNLLKSNLSFLFVQIFRRVRNAQICFADVIANVIFFCINYWVFIAQMAIFSTLAHVIYLRVLQGHWTPFSLGTNWVFDKQFAPIRSRIVSVWDASPL